MVTESIDAATFLPEHPADLASVVSFLANHQRHRGTEASPSYALVGINEHDRIELPQSVHEALNHTSLVNFTHLVWHVGDWNESRADCSTILSRCSHYGVGLITFGAPSDLTSYVLHLPARRHDPSPDAFDEFVETRLSQDDRTKLLSWITELRR
mgnify:CR=1 FL=1